MSRQLANSEIGAAFGEFFYAGAGPSHTNLSRAFMASGYQDADPYDPETKTPNKQERVLTVFRAAKRQPHKSRTLVEELLTLLRTGRYFEAQSNHMNAKASTQTLIKALRHNGWDLDKEYRLIQVGHIDLATGGREALDEQLARLRRNTEDPAALVGGAKDLLESIAKFVLEEAQMLPNGKKDYPGLLTLAFECLRIKPGKIDPEQPGAKQVNSIYQSAFTTTLAIGELRNLQGTGHGRTLPTGVTVEAARYVIKQATHVADLMLSTHARQMGYP